MFMKNASDVAIRVARTFLQSAIGTFLGLFVTGQFTRKVGEATLPNWDSLTTLGIAAGTAGVVAAVSFIYNLLDSSNGAQVLPKLK
jgi:hypothetical protein